MASEVENQNKKQTEQKVFVVQLMHLIVNSL